jgi:hypothetical protein
MSQDTLFQKFKKNILILYNNIYNFYLNYIKSPFIKFLNLLFNNNDLSNTISTSISTDISHNIPNNNEINENNNNNEIILRRFSYSDKNINELHEVSLNSNFSISSFINNDYINKQK